MANEQGFSHITVTADEDDDIVIQAGTPTPTAEEDAVVAVAAQGPANADAPANTDAPAVADEATSIDIAPDGETTSPGADDRADAVSRTSSEQSSAKAVPAPARKDKGYHETTLEDLEGSKMTPTQKAVIVVALLGIVAFVAWYLLAH